MTVKVLSSPSYLEDMKMAIPRSAHSEMDDKLQLLLKMFPMRKTCTTNSYNR